MMISGLTEEVTRYKSHIEELSSQLSEAQRDISSNKNLTAQITDALTARDEAMDNNRGRIVPKLENPPNEDHVRKKPKPI